MLGNQCYHNNFIVWPLANPYINNQYEYMLCQFTQNVDFRLNTMLHGALHMLKLLMLKLVISILFIRSNWSLDDVHL